MSAGGPTLLIMAAGMGSRFGGLKQMEPVGPGGETLLDYSVYDARRAGFERVVFIIRRAFEATFRERVGRRLADRMAVDYVYQELDVLPPGHSVPPGRSKPWGTGHAIWCARRTVNEPFVVINGDDFYGRDAFSHMAAFLASTASAPADDGLVRFAMAGYELGATLSSFGTVSRGVCELDPAGRLRRITEVTNIERTATGAGRVRSPGGGERTIAAGALVSMNFWGLTPAVFGMVEKQFLGFLAGHGDESGSEFYLPAVIQHAIESRQATVEVLPARAQWFGVTHRDDLPRVRDSIARLVASGVYPEAL